MNAAAKLRGCLRVSLTTNLVTALSFTFFALDAPAQVQIEQAPIQLGDIQLQVLGDELIGDPFGASANRAGLLEPAELKTDSGSQEILTQADAFVKQERYDLASILWQRVIDESGDQVFTRDDWLEKTLQNEYRKYRSVTGDIESTLAKLPPEGLAAYRLKADGEARALMNAADSKNRESALAEIVRRFFLSKLGDEAAFELACLKLDRGEFLPAARLLAKIATEYPDPTVRLGEIQLRLAAVNARVGEVKLAREMLGEIKSQPIPPVPVAVIKLVEADIEVVASERTSGGGRDGSWTMPLGGPQRSGLMPAPGEVAGGVVKAWTQRFELTTQTGGEWDTITSSEEAKLAKASDAPKEEALAQLMANDPFGGRITATPAKPLTDDEVVERWKEKGWLPVGQVLMHEGRLYFRTHDRVAVCDASSGDLLWWTTENDYPVDPTTAMKLAYPAYNRNASNSGEPSSLNEVMGFEDVINQSMSIVGGKLLVVQGRSSVFYEDGDLDEAGIEENGINNLRMRRAFGGAGESQGRARDNRLFAFDIATEGKILWMLKPSELLPESKRKMAFAGSPVPYGSLVVLPAFEGSSLWLFGIDPENGSVLWKSFIADEPANQTAINSAVRVAIDGGEAYVATGAGIVASVDAISGTLNWAVAYPRTSPTSLDANQRNNARFSYSVQQVALDGWADDTIIPSGNAIVFAASDFNHLAALDRRTGDLLWESARRPIDGEPASEYVLGVADGRVFVAGHDIVRAYQLSGGRLLWEHVLEQKSHGRGMLTRAGIYIPLERSILHLATTSGDVLESIPAELGGATQPLGNLYTDGERIFSAGYRELSTLRARQPGEELPQPLPAPAAVPEPASPPIDSPDGADAGGATTHDSLAQEARDVIAGAFDRLATAADADAVREAGKGFDLAGDQLEKIAARMDAFGSPDAAKRATLAAVFATANAQTAEKFTESIARIIRLEGVGGDAIERVVGLHKRAEALPILKAYGIEIDGRGEGGPQRAPGVPEE